MDGETQTLSLTYQELDRCASCDRSNSPIGRSRRRKSDPPIPSRTRIPCGFFGCLYAGVVAFPPTPQTQSLPNSHPIHFGRCQSYGCPDNQHVLSTLEKQFDLAPELKALKCWLPIASISRSPKTGANRRFPVELWLFSSTPPVRLPLPKVWRSPTKT